MKQLFSILLMLASFAAVAQNQVKQDLNYSFKFCIEKTQTTSLGFSLFYNATERALYLDSPAASTASRYDVKVSVNTNLEIKFYTEFGVFAFQKDVKGVVTHCIFISTDLTTVLIFTNNKKGFEKPIIADNPKDLRRK